MAPVNSFIHYEEFKTPRDFVDYLKYLDKNDTAYMEYFEWRKSYPGDYRLFDAHDEEYQYSTNSEYSVFLYTYCNLSKMLRTRNATHGRQVSSLRNHWYFIPHEDTIVEIINLTKNFIYNQF